MDTLKTKSIPNDHHFEKRSTVLEWLSSQSQFSTEKVSILKSLSQEYTLQGYQLGEIITSQTNGDKSVDETEFFHFVCEGRARLLGFDPDKQKEVSSSLLLEGEVFGGHSLWYENPLGYKVQAASPVIIARISVTKLKPFLAKLPELDRQWRVLVHNQQKLIFFKTLTELRALSSHRLKKLSNYLNEKKIKAGTTVPATENIRYWLREGQIKDSQIKIGDFWGDSPTSDYWLAQTNLWFYELPQANWQMVAELAPEIFSSRKSDSNSPPTQMSLVREGSPVDVHAISKVNPVSYQENHRNDDEFSEKTAIQEQEQEINYPEPKQRRRFWQTYPHIEQQSSSDCGATCIAMISRYWQKKISINYLRELIGTGRTGASLKNLATAAENIGYHARPVRASLSRIIDHKNPWIAHWQGEHYVVVYRVKKNKFLIADPALGKFELSRQEFITCWTGFALLLEPTADLAQAPTEKRSLGKFLVLLKPYYSVGLTIIIASILIQLLGIVSPLFTQIILDQVVVNRSQSTLNVLVVGILLFGVLGIGLSAIRNYLLSYLANRLDLTMISGFINHALNLPLKFFESRRVGDIITRVQENQKIQQFLISNLLLSWLDFLTGFIYLGLMLYYNWKLTALILLLIPPIIVLTLAATPLLRRISRQRFSATADQNSALVEMMTGISTVKAVTAEKDLRWRWEELLTNQLNVQFKNQKLAINLGFVSGMINSVGGVLLLWYGASLVIQGELSIGQYVAFNMMKGYIINPVLKLVGMWDELQEVLISVERLNDVFEAKSEVANQNDKLVLGELQGSIQLDNVTFRYDEGEEINILQNISLNIVAGQTVAIVGRSGSGKSTLVKMIQGMYHPTSGDISVDGHNLEHISLGSLRSQIGVVPQDCFLFSGTILENITMYNADVSLEEVITTARLAEAHSFIQALPLGYNTKVGERGDNLSGGQRQRIAIARAFMGSPPILILDEATSSLDTESERRFQENLTRLTNQCTTIIIAHRLSTVRNADRIVVLDQGMIVEQGNHEELCDQKGLYYELAKQQLSL